MKHYDINKLINESGFSNYNQIAEFLINEFDRTNDYAEKLEIIQFAKSNNIDVVGLASGNKVMEFYSQPIMTADEVKANIKQIAEPTDITPPVDEQIKQVLD